MCLRRNGEQQYIKALKLILTKLSERHGIFHPMQSVSLSEKVTNFWFLPASSRTSLPNRLEPAQADHLDQFVFGRFIKCSDNKLAVTETWNSSQGSYLKIVGWIQSAQLWTKADSLISPLTSLEQLYFTLLNISKDGGFSLAAELLLLLRI